MEAQTIFDGLLNWGAAGKEMGVDLEGIKEDFGAKDQNTLYESLNKIFIFKKPSATSVLISTY